MPKARKQWVYTPPKPTISPALMREVDQMVQPMVVAWKAKYIQPPPSDPRFNYLIDIWTKWHRSAFYFCGTYACPGSDAISQTFEVRYTRMTYAGERNFHLAYMRHTGQWWELFTNIPIEEALQTIDTTPHLQPM